MSATTRRNSWQRPARCTGPCNDLSPAMQKLRLPVWLPGTGGRYGHFLNPCGWKAVKNGPEAGVELYDLSADLGETRDVAAKHPELARRLDAIMRREHRPAPPQVDLTAKESRRRYLPKVGVREP